MTVNIPQCPSLEKLTLDLDSVGAYLPHFLPTPPPPAPSLPALSPPTATTTPDAEDKSPEPAGTGSLHVPDITIRVRISTQNNQDTTSSDPGEQFDLSLDTATEAKLLCLRDIVLEKGLKRFTLRLAVDIQTSTNNVSASSSGASNVVLVKREAREMQARRMAVQREVRSVLRLERGVCDVAFVWE